MGTKNWYPAIASVHLQRARHVVRPRQMRARHHVELAGVVTLGSAVGRHGGVAALRVAGEHHLPESLAPTASAALRAARTESMTVVACESACR